MPIPTKVPPVILKVYQSQSKAHSGVVAVSATIVPPEIVSVPFESIASLLLEYA